ncbi:hypothetical protein AB1N83_011468 [Pleurotus pulmonarius]
MLNHSSAHQTKCPEKIHPMKTSFLLSFSKEKRACATAPMLTPSSLQYYYHCVSPYIRLSRVEGANRGFIFLGGDLRKDVVAEMVHNCVPLERIDLTITMNVSLRRDIAESD